MIRILIKVSVLLVFFSCAKRHQSFAGNYQFAHPVTSPDYANLDYWAAHPAKWDPSDSVSKDLRSEKRDTVVDVFFIYPTSYTKEKTGWNADINDAELNAKTDYASILYQASVFNQHCRVYAPRYRQAHISAFFIRNDETNAAFDTAYADLRRAFQYYLEHENHNRPVIIAGHSQGALMCIRLLKEFFDGKPLQQKLVASYILGWPVARNSFKAIPVCASPEQTGCFCSWRTFKKDYMPDYIPLEQPQAWVTNPLSWDTTARYVPSSKNYGSILRNFNEVVQHTTDAQVHEGVLWVNKPKFRGSVFLTTSNYHIADVNFFYVNLRQNIEERINNYLRLH